MKTGNDGVARGVVLGLVLVLLSLGVAPAAWAQATRTHCPPGQQPHYVFGFRALSEVLGERMGDPLTCEFPDVRGTGDVHQLTTQGLAFWRKASNTPTFTNGWDHWGLTAAGLVYWAGTAIDPPPSAVVVPLSQYPAHAFGGTRGPIEQPAPPAPPMAQLTAVRVGQHAGFDRVVFEFQGALPGYRVAYVQPPIVQDASGLLVDISGSAFLQVRFSPATGYDFVRSAPSYPGPNEIRPNLPTLLELERTGDFEAVLTWTLGLRQAVDFHVLELSNPWRVVVDVAHP